ncbi:2-C-methyl-D-erythritol 4-phosphate cytidylyltransferase [Parapedobacter koreensis]|uniref:2-C-methyl-D-erythritol 4-phosphate cytidylyltransferase n=1 Tax=Parapedobacter koreensis TaxID=332977 RepID=A0A1H7LY98_9SPHI|nr:2-C-methyl-D-erythritol 4-phosphate cytidylyltransferase [Parapedobacter koreensis]SEL03980.1 2-C-methyl-D-erythritol 4-phosphate cytidylyltransferase [Parapedobacter koreensis]
MNYVIIVAGGTGSRMDVHTPKQFLLLNGMPVMMHAIQAFHKSQSAPQIIVVLHAGMRETWSALCQTHRFDIPHSVVTGGESRFGSVKKGLEALKAGDVDLSQSLIAIHDAARPLITPGLIDSTYEQASRTGAAALAVRSTNSVRIVSNNGLKNNAHRRETVYLMQTPQTFSGTILSEAYEAPEQGMYTDDSSVVEKKGYPISLIDGDTRNIKITFPEDLAIAEILLRTMD